MEYIFHRLELWKKSSTFACLVVPTSILKINSEIDKSFVDSFSKSNQNIGLYFFWVKF